MKKNINFNLEYFINLGLHLGVRLQNRKIWIYNFILGSRGSWDILNILELLKSLEILGPIIVSIVKKGGTILVINKKMSLESKSLSKLFSTQPFIGIIHLYLDNWLEGTFTNFFNFKFLNLRQLPSILFLLDFTHSANLLNEAYFLRIPVIALVDSSQNFINIFKKIAIPIPANNSIKSLFFFFNFLKYYILKGLYFYDYSIVKDTFFSSFIFNLKNFKYSIKNTKILNQFLYKNFKHKKFLYFFNNYLLQRTNNFDVYNNTLESMQIKKFAKNKLLSKINALAVYNRKYIQKYYGMVKTFTTRLDEFYSNKFYKFKLRKTFKKPIIAKNETASFVVKMLERTVNKINLDKKKTYNNNYNNNIKKIYNNSNNKLQTKQEWHDTKSRLQYNNNKSTTSQKGKNYYKSSTKKKE